MTPEEQSAKAAFEAMCDTYVARHPQRERITALDSWERQSPECREDWVAAIRAAVAEERERCAKVAEEMAVTHDGIGKLVRALEIAAAIRGSDAPK